MTHDLRSIVISRTDRIGDVVLTLPVFSVLRKACPQAKLIAHVRSYTAPLLDGHPDVDEILLDDQDGTPLPFLDLVRELRVIKPDAAILVHPAGRAVAACWLARIPLMAGRASNIWQFLLTHRLVQHRSRNEKHEADYNLELLTGLGISPARALPQLYIRENTRAWAAQRLISAGIQTPPVFVHPGHGGSAHNLPLNRYIELVCGLRGAGLPVIVTLGPAESSLAEAFGPPIPGEFAVIDDAPDAAHLAALLATGLGFAGGSTGPMHLAAATGIHTIAFFPRREAMTPYRWGPLGPLTHVLMPPEEAGDHPDAMSRLDIWAAVAILAGLLKPSRKGLTG